MTKKQKWTIGAILKIPLTDGWHCYSQMLPHENCEMAFYDSRTRSDLSPSEIVNMPVLFRAAVHKSAYNDGWWLKIGTVKVPDNLMEPRATFIEDRISGKFQIYKFGDIRPASKEQCVGLESASVWEANHLEDRLSNHYAGRKCVWLDEFWRNTSS